MTSNRSGLCTQHEEMEEERNSSSFQVTDRRRSSINPMDRRPGAPLVLMGSQLPALPDLPQGELRPEHLSAQIEGLIASSVTLHLQRNVLSCLKPDGSVDDNTLGSLYHDTLRRNTISLRPLSDEMAVQLSHMVEDEFGPDEDDAVFLAGYALSKKWQLGTSNSEERDDLGIAYGASYAEYVAAYNERLRPHASNTFIDLVSESLPQLIEDSATKKVPYEVIVQQIGSSGQAHIQDIMAGEREDRERTLARRESRNRLRRSIAERLSKPGFIERAAAKAEADGASAAIHNERYAQQQMQKNIQEINEKMP